MTQRPEISPSTAPAAPQRRRLGRGLDSLISTPVRVEIPQPNGSSSADRDVRNRDSDAARSAAAPTAVTDDAQQNTPNGITAIAVTEIAPNRNQPRQQFDETALAALAESIRADGLMQPIVVRRAQPGSGAAFELIAGERRWRAAQRIGLQRVPAIIREVDDRTATELALIENLQREDLNPIERAEAFQLLADRYSLTHDQIGNRVGLDRTSISNLIRLNNLDMFTKDAVRSGRLSLGHARALLSISDAAQRTRLARRVIEMGWSVRELERHTQQATAGSRERSTHDQVAAAHRRDLEKRLGEHLGTKVHIVTARKKGAGRIIVEFFSLDQFEGLMERMGYRSDDSP